jgi:hypothetical protein
VSAYIILWQTQARFVNETEAKLRQNVTFVSVKAVLINNGDGLPSGNVALVGEGAEKPQGSGVIALVQGGMTILKRPSDSGSSNRHQHDRCNYCTQYFATITENAQFLQVLIGLIGKNSKINAFFSKTPRTLEHPRLPSQSAI